MRLTSKCFYLKLHGVGKISMLTSAHPPWAAPQGGSTTRWCRLSVAPSKSSQHCSLLTAARMSLLALLGTRDGTMLVAKLEVDQIQRIASRSTTACIQTLANMKKTSQLSSRISGRSSVTYPVERSFHSPLAHQACGAHRSLSSAAFYRTPRTQS